MCLISISDVLVLRTYWKENHIGYQLIVKYIYPIITFYIEYHAHLNQESNNNIEDLLSKLQIFFKFGALNLKFFCFSES
jgi:hypothetical protein